MKKLFALFVAVLSSSAFAQQGPQGYLTDSNGQIVRSGTGLCWHTGYWTPALSVEGCDPVTKAGPVGTKVTLAADTLFDFDKSTLKPEGKVALDNVIRHAQGIKIEIFAVIGYTDRIGSDKYNLALSDRRAAAVKAYFVSQGVPADAIITQGRGKANPVTGDTCKGQVGKKLISCLQPDRRAVVEIIGTK